MMTYDAICDRLNDPDSREKQMFDSLMNDEYMDPDSEFDEMVNIIQARLRSEGDDYDDSMDGDHESAFASIGWGTDEDYGGGMENI